MHTQTAGEIFIPARKVLGKNAFKSKCETDERFTGSLNLIAVVNNQSII